MARLDPHSLACRAELDARTLPDCGAEAVSLRFDRSREQRVTSEFDEALRRLQASVGLLETALGRRFGDERGRQDLETELQVMQDDRARLSVELESATERLNRLEAATDHVGRRVQAAIGTLHEVLADPVRRLEA